MNADPSKYHLYLENGENTVMNSAICDVCVAAGAKGRWTPGLVEEAWHEEIIDETRPRGFDYRLVAYSGILCMRKSNFKTESEKLSFLTNYIAAVRGVKVFPLLK